METVHLVLAAFGAVFVTIFAAYALFERDLRQASRKTSRRAGGLASGASVMAGAALLFGAQFVAQLPEIALVAVGLWSIMQGVSVEVFLAVSTIVYVTAEAINGPA